MFLYHPIVHYFWAVCWIDRVLFLGSSMLELWNFIFKLPWDNLFENVINVFCLNFSILLFLYKIFLKLQDFVNNSIYNNFSSSRKLIVILSLFWLLYLVDYGSGVIKMCMFYSKEENKGRMFLPYPEQKIILDYLGYKNL